MFSINKILGYAQYTLWLSAIPFSQQKFFNVVKIHLNVPSLMSYESCNNNNNNNNMHYKHIVLHRTCHMLEYIQKPV